MARGRLRRRRTPGLHLAGPIWRPNTVPLASVWLIGAAMLMGVYVNPTHALLIDLPQPRIIPPDLPTPAIRVLRVGREGEISLDGIALPDDALRRRLTDLDRQIPRPGIILSAAPSATYIDTLRAIAILKEAGLTEPNFCFGQIERFRRFENTHKDQALDPHPDWVGCDPFSYPIP